MTFDPKKHHRRSIRLPDYDYGWPGGYFVTIVTAHRQCLFGYVKNAQVHLNAAGSIVVDAWLQLTTRFQHMELDYFVVMPNHVHGVVLIQPPGLQRTDARRAAGSERGAASSAPTSKSATLADMVRAFKSLSARRINRRLRRRAAPLWQRNYYEHIIRSDDDLQEIRRYIDQNPLHWATDPDNPDS